MGQDRENIYKDLDRIFDAGWNDFVKRIQADNRRSNQRLFKVLTPIIGQPFVNDLIRLKHLVNAHGLFTIVRKPSGIEMEDKRWRHIPKLWIDQRPNERGETSGFICIKIKENRWLKLHYNNG